MIPLSTYLQSKEKKIFNMNRLELLKEIKKTETKFFLLKKELNALTKELFDHEQAIKMIQNELQKYKRLPFIVCTISEILKVKEVVGAKYITNTDKVDVAGKQNNVELIVINALTRLKYLLPNSGLIKPGVFKVGDLAAISRDGLKLVDLLPSEYDPRIKVMEVINQPNQQFCDIGGLDNQIQEMIEAVIYPITHKEYFEAFRVQPPKGVLMYGPPGTGKTLLARALASNAKCTFLKLSGTALLQRYIGEGGKMVREAFRLAKEKAPTVLFIDEIDSIGSKRRNSERGSDHEVHRTMLELLTQMDGFKVNENIRVIAATNRPDVLDPALTRSGRFDRKVELPLPNEKARVQIMRIHAQKMNVSPKVNFEELARCTNDFNGAQCKAVVTEAGMVALRENKVQITHEHFLAAILEYYKIV
ncbi:26S protease regulatory subunit 6A [Trichinella sp. T8]|uniref:26S protease regulatory subunit 6A n=1 Tax=Trichinella murrelli TaxID=144512 RepID=A0A0V0UBY4_9BILA|nr:26S protease regulatory subunit 6A [Trichinella murrelli]KRZ92940.1 26S protease regulatory subunit 6A [Trichinella sp. T8]